MRDPWQREMPTGTAVVTGGQHRPGCDPMMGEPYADARTCLLVSVSLIRRGPPETKIPLKNYYLPLTCHTEEKLGQRLADTFS